MSTQLGKTVAEPVKPEEQLDYHALNAMLNLYDANGKIQFEKDREAANQFFLQHVNQNTVYFHDLEEKIDYLINNKYYDPQVIEQYDFSFIKELFKRAYSYKFRFKSFLGAYKYYTSYTLKTFDGRRYLERFEDRVSMTALFLADGDAGLAEHLVDEIMTGRFQPATPTFLNAGKAQRGEPEGGEQDAPSSDRVGQRPGEQQGRDEHGDVDGEDQGDHEQGSQQIQNNLKK